MSSEKNFSGLNVLYDSQYADYSNHCIMVKSEGIEYFVTVFSSVITGDNRGLLLKTVGANGLSPVEHYVTDNTIGEQKDGYLVVEPGTTSGDFYVVWTESSSGHWRTMIRKFKVGVRGFSPVTESIQLCGENGDYVGPRLTALGTGGEIGVNTLQLVATWVSVAEQQIEMVGITCTYGLGDIELNTYTREFEPEHALMSQYWSSSLNLSENETHAVNTVVDIALSSNHSDTAYIAVKSSTSQIDLYSISLPGGGSVSNTYLQSIAHTSIDHFDMIYDQTNNQLAVVFIDHDPRYVIGSTVPIFGKAAKEARANVQLNTGTFECTKPRIIWGSDQRFVVSWQTDDSCGYVGTYTHDFISYGAERAVNIGVNSTDLLSCAVTLATPIKILTACNADRIGETELTNNGILYDVKLLNS